MPAILAKIPNARTIMVGTGPEKKRLRNLVKTLGLHNSVNFVGFVPQNEIPAYYENCDVYIHLAKQEPFGFTVIEAQAFGKPVITVAEGGPKETVLDGKTGFLIKADVETLANQIIRLLQDNELRNRLGREAKEYIKTYYDWRSAIQRFLNVCEELKNENF
jgi:glycosyltransferase involved in cell wall biosynthesis